MCFIWPQENAPRHLYPNQLSDKLLDNEIPAAAAGAEAVGAEAAAAATVPPTPPEANVEVRL